FLFFGLVLPWLPAKILPRRVRLSPLPIFFSSSRLSKFYQLMIGCGLCRNGLRSQKKCQNVILHFRICRQPIVFLANECRRFREQNILYVAGQRKRRCDQGMFCNNAVALRVYHPFYLIGGNLAP